ncbi:hypothetical protein BTA51_18590 [Hahella sp. CCB-MM4]|uniref:hypothetical protein n=1 Tax=Hahella sp. (strain CCB-MM4) TaxID=1926491 RepID=UPI000B9BC075|nr:hypothetical protein [Hahella sp. CCB-MM4]OZG72007.1 hypothetical protein BTA51_18590 [Hahella sp. CCB-MM4]
MSITRYLPGEHPSGFSGWQVAVVISGKHHQRYLSDQPPSLVSTETWCQYQELKARIIELKLKRRLAVRQYFQFIRSEDLRTKPARRVGVRGISADIQSKSGEWRCGFKVSGGSESAASFFEISSETSFTEAWESAIDCWGHRFGIREKDCALKKSSAPPMEIFKNLRRILNEEGSDVPVSVLGPVYAEQRQQIAGKKDGQDSKRLDIDESDILQWFKRETGSKVA